MRLALGESATLTLALLLVLVGLTGPVTAQAPTPKLCAVFVEEEVGKAVSDEVADRLGAFENMIVSQVTDLGFRSMSIGDTVKSMQSMAHEDNAVDQKLDASTSALRIAQNMGADYLLMASVDTFDRSQTEFNQRGVQMTIIQHDMTCTYKVLGGAIGESLTAGMVEVQRTTRQTGGLQRSQNVTNALLRDAAKQIAQKLQLAQQDRRIPGPDTGKDDLIDFSIVCGVAGMQVPEIITAPDGSLVVSEKTLELEAMNVDVELNGVVIGSAPGDFQAPPGLHRLRLFREGFKPMEAFVSFRDGQLFQRDLQMTDEARAKYMQMSSFLAGLKRGERLNQAQADMIHGVADWYRQNFVAIQSDVTVNRRSDVDVKSDVKADVQVDRKSDVKIDHHSDITVDSKDVADAKSAENRSVWSRLISGE